MVRSNALRLSLSALLVVGISPLVVGAAQSESPKAETETTPTQSPAADQKPTEETPRDQPSAEKPSAAGAVSDTPTLQPPRDGASLATSGFTASASRIAVEASSSQDRAVDRR